MLRQLLLAGFAILGVAGSASSADAAIYTFTNGAANTFSVTNSSGTNTATFTSSSGAGTFSVANSGFFTFGTGLGDYSSFNGDPLTITFTTPITTGGIVIPFGLEDAFGSFGSDTLTATASNGQVVTASTTLNSGVFPEPEGTLFLQPTSAISSLTLTSANPFAIANVQVPEPMSFSILGLGLAGFAALRRKNRAV